MQHYVLKEKCRPSLSGHALIFFVGFLCLHHGELSYVLDELEI